MVDYNLEYNQSNDYDLEYGDVSSSSVTKEYVDTQDTATLQSAKDYTDAHHDSTKQDTISDLDDIRSGANLGATAVQPNAITDMATKTWVGQQGFPYNVIWPIKPEN